MKKPEPSPNLKSEVIESVSAEKKLRTLFSNFGAPVVDGLVLIHSELLKASKTVSLVPGNTLSRAEIVHIADSVLATRLIVPSLVAGHPVYDLFSGNGFPSLVFALLNPSQEVILVDRDARKLDFSRGTSRMLGLKNLRFQELAIDQIPDRSVMNAVTRGPLAFSKALLAARKPVGKGGRFFHMKGDGWANELAGMPSQLFTHWSPNLSGQYRLPDSLSEMFVVRTDKLSD